MAPSGRAAGRPHSVRLEPARRELAAPDTIWRALERLAASVALVHFAGGGGRPARVTVLALAADSGQLGRWEAGETELADALAAPVWARYGSFRGQPLITGTLCWKVPERSITLTGTRGSQPFAQTLASAPRSIPQPDSDMSRDTSSPLAAITPRATMRALRRGDRPHRPFGGALLRQTLPPGGLPRPAT